MASTTKSRATALPLTPTKAGGVVVPVVPNFAVFIDTHRDQPHVPTFEDDIHRGMSRPTMVHYRPPAPGAPPDDLGSLVRVEDGLVINVDPKHRFVEVEWWEDYVGDYVMANGEPPFATTGETKGQLPTSHLRNARTKVYKLKSLRQIVRSWEKASATVTATPKAKKPKPHLTLGTPITVPLTSPTALKKPVAKKAPVKKSAAIPPAPYTGPTTTDHPFLGLGDDKGCLWPWKSSSGVGFCGLPKEAHA